MDEMVDVRQTPAFKSWLRGLKDPATFNRIVARLTRLRTGFLGDVKPVGDGVSELRMNFGPGYRIYFKRYGNTIILLLCGGNKKTQKDDIKRAKLLAKEINEDDVED